MSQYLAGGLLHKNLGEVVQALLTRHLLAFRRKGAANAQPSASQTQRSGPPIKQPVKVMPALASIREAWARRTLSPL
jgi:hypothetical protein